MLPAVVHCMWGCRCLWPHGRLAHGQVWVMEQESAKGAVWKQEREREFFGDYNWELKSINPSGFYALVVALSL